jgi:hypothetical protein
VKTGIIEHGVNAWVLEGFGCDVRPRTRLGGLCDRSIDRMGPYNTMLRSQSEAALPKLPCGL